MKIVIAILFFTISPIILKAQIISLFAGSGTIEGDGGPATMANIPDPINGVFDNNGNYYFVSCLGGNRVRRIDTAGIITTIAGTGVLGYNGDGILAISAQLYLPNAVRLDSKGDLFICEGGGNRIRKVNMISGIISTYAGNGVASYSGDSGAATLAMINDPQDICIDKLGNLYIADWGNERIRKVDTNGIISTIAGVGIAGFSGNGSLADTCKIGSIVGVCFDSMGNLFLADNENSRIFIIDSSGIINTVAGTNTGYLFNGDNIPATTANIDPGKIAFDNTGNLYISEYHNYRVRKVDLLGFIHTVAGNGTAGSSGDGGPATAAEFDYPSGLAFDKCGNLYITDIDPGLINKVTLDSTCDPYTTNVPQLTNNQIVIYPNPVVDELHIEGILNMEKYRLLNIKNNIEQAGTLQMGSNTIDIRALPPGIYFLEMIDEKGYKEVRKVVKISP